MKGRYSHDEGAHNLDSPREIVPEIIRILQPSGVVDMGCGIGTFLYCFKENGVTDVLGIDGAWAKGKLMDKYLTQKEFQEANLENKITLAKKYDLVVSLEVAEHLHEKSADTFVENLINAGNIILFSAAIPLQGGQNHINEQWLDYWEAKFARHNYVVHDVLKPIFWNNPKIAWWYKQNVVLVTPRDFKFQQEMKYNVLKNVVHPELYMSKAKGDIKRYVKMIIGHRGSMLLKRLARRG